MRVTITDDDDDENKTDKASTKEEDARTDKDDDDEDYCLYEDEQGDEAANADGDTVTATEYIFLLYCSTIIHLIAALNTVLR